jgi:hypothetical protein
VSELLLYSTNTWLAFNISQQFFKGKHYIWCTPYFDSTTDPFIYTVAPTSSPKDICLNLLKEVKQGDRHSSKIIDNKSGILRGASIKRNLNVISEEEEKEIIAIVDNAETRDFSPLVYIIPHQKVKRLVEKVPPEKKAHPLSNEFIIQDLPRTYFDIIDLKEFI